MADGPFVGPDGVFGTSLRLVVAGEDDKHLFGLAVAVPVVVGEVHFLVGQLAGLVDHLGGRGAVASVVVIASVVGHVARHGDGSHHVEGEVQLSVGLVLEVVVHAAGVAEVGVALLVHHVGEDGVGVLVLHLDVLVVDQDDDALAFAHGVGRFAHGSARGLPCSGSPGRPLGVAFGRARASYLLEGRQCGSLLEHEAGLVGRALRGLMGQHAGRAEEVALQAGVVEASVVVAHQGHAVERLVIVERFVAHQQHRDGGAVGLLEGEGRGLGRHRPGLCDA